VSHGLKVIYQRGKAYTLAETPVNSVRSYVGSRNYRDIVSIISDEDVAFHSVDSFDLIESTPAFGQKIVDFADYIDDNQGLL